MGPSGTQLSVLWLAQKPLQSRIHEQDCSAEKGIPCSILSLTFRIP